MPIYQNLYQTLLPCPIVELRGYLAACGLRGRLYAYLDYNGPTGTARDNLAEGMLALADERGALKPGQPVIEASSGAFALALTLAGQTAGHPVVLAMPEDAPALRQEQLLRLGAKILHVPARGGLSAARALARQTAAEKGWYYMNWLANDDNPTFHRRVTASWTPSPSGWAVQAPSRAWARPSRPGPTMCGSWPWSLMNPRPSAAG